MRRAAEVGATDRWRLRDSCDVILSVALLDGRGTGAVSRPNLLSRGVSETEGTAAGSTADVMGGCREEGAASQPASFALSLGEIGVTGALRDGTVSGSSVTAVVVWREEGAASQPASFTLSRGEGGVNGAFALAVGESRISVASAA